MAADRLPDPAHTGFGDCACDDCYPVEAMAEPFSAAVSPADTPDFRMLCAICSEPLNGAILTEDCKWVHPECEENAEWNEEPL